MWNVPLMNISNSKSITSCRQILIGVSTCRQRRLSSGELIYIDCVTHFLSFLGRFHLLMESASFSVYGSFKSGVNPLIACVEKFTPVLWGEIGGRDVDGFLKCLYNLKIYDEISKE